MTKPKVIVSEMDVAEDTRNAMNAKALASFLTGQSTTFRLVVDGREQRQTRADIRKQARKIVKQILEDYD